MTAKVKRDVDREREEASIKMFASSANWPHLLLPVKNYDLAKEGDAFGLLGVIATPAAGIPLVIYETVMFNPDFKNCKQHVYASVMDAIEAGWVVD